MSEPDNILSKAWDHGAAKIEWVPMLPHWSNADARREHEALMAAVSSIVKRRREEINREIKPLLDRAQELYEQYAQPRVMPIVTAAIED